MSSNVTNGTRGGDGADKAGGSSRRIYPLEIFLIPTRRRVLRSYFFARTLRDLAGEIEEAHHR